MAVAREACTIFRAIVWLIWDPYAEHAACHIESEDLTIQNLCLLLMPNDQQC